MIRRRIVVGLVVTSQLMMSCASHTIPVNTQSNGVERLPSSELSETPWTTWSEKNTEAASLHVLSGIRTNLLKNNLHDPHFNYASYKQVDCTKTNTKFRSADGTCYDPKHPLAGAANVAFGRNVDPKFIDKEASKKLMTPNPEVVSDVFFTRDEFKPVPFLNMLAAVWIQFMNHDWLTHGKNMEASPYVVQGKDGSTQLVERTQDNATPAKQYKNEYGKVSLNEVTHWWDASQIYGSNQASQSELRSFADGKMKMATVNGQTLLPKNMNLDIGRNKQNQGYEATGFRDNWWVGLSMLHTLFVKEHNAVADMLKKKYVTYDQASGKYIWNGQDKKVSMTAAQVDEEIFQTARLVNAAILAKIHTVEWTPAILPNGALKRAMHVNWYGAANAQTWGGETLNKVPVIGKLLNQTKGTSVCNDSFLVCGIVGSKRNDYGVPYSITEEFTSVYRLHSLLPEKLVFKNESNKSIIEEVPFKETRNEKAYSIMQKYGEKDLFYSFGTQLPGQLVLNNFPEFMQNLEIPVIGKMDLGMVDVMRDRERGVPRYNQFRRAIGLKPIKAYRDFFPPTKTLDARQQAVVKKFETVYGFDAQGNDNVELVDLLVGTLAEEVRPKDDGFFKLNKLMGKPTNYFGFGETMFQIFILMASRRLMADPYFTDYYNADHYTKAGLQWIDREGTLAQVIGRHMPELAPHMKGLDTAFAPWK